MIINLLIDNIVYYNISICKYGNGNKEMKMGKDKVLFSPGIRYFKFMRILEKTFLPAEQTDIDKKIKSFFGELEKSSVGEEEFAEDLIYYFKEVFLTGDQKTTDRPLHASRDFALDLFAKVFSDKFDDFLYPRKRRSVKKNDPLRKINFLMFLAGIIDDPDVSSPISKRIGLISKSDDTVLITGETGTGKELHAKVIHYLSNRLKERFIAVNCAGIPDTLLESELFGITKNTATGVGPKEGILNTVGEGTLFLDEIGDMPLTLQAKVLRVLQSRQFNKIGDPGTIYHFKGRVIAATNRDIKKEIKKSPPTFRPDLYYRLNVLPIELPPLSKLSERERKTAILNKLRHIIFLKTKEPGDITHMKFLSGYYGPVQIMDDKGEIVEAKNPFVSDEALQHLVNYDFPGNYRELDNVIRRAYVLSDNKKIEVSALTDEVVDHKICESQNYEGDLINVDNVCLKDIVEHAERIKQNIVRQKVKSIYLSGRDFRAVLRNEGIKDDAGYQRIRKRIVGIIGKKEMAQIRKS